MVRLLWMLVLLTACQGIGRGEVAKPPQEAKMVECKGVHIRVRTVAWVGEYRVGLEGFSGEEGAWKARLVFVDPRAGEDSPPAWEGEVAAGQSFEVAGQRFRVTEVRRGQGTSDLPGSDPGFVCIETM